VQGVSKNGMSASGAPRVEYPADFEARYLSGRELWGDGFSVDEIERWLEDEREAYADLGAAEHGTAESYEYHKLNIRHGFRWLPPRTFTHALGLGSAYGGEFLPIVDRLERITILEPSFALRTASLGSTPVTYVDPVASGDMPFDSDSFDLVLSLGTLHHIANVSSVVAEIARVTVPGGFILIREPVVSMGDPRSPRPGLTKRERGIPRRLFVEMFAAANLDVMHHAPCLFPTTRRLARVRLGFNSAAGVLADQFLSSILARTYRYHPVTRWQKLQASASFYVLQRRAATS
jgi:SAM-dependent methyltransferase